MTFNLDGEPLSGTQFRIEVVPGALQCRLPPDCAFALIVLPGGG
jgi:diacylglycerol kinase family enzyme